MLEPSAGSQQTSEQASAHTAPNSFGTFSNPQWVSTFFDFVILYHFVKGTANIVCNAFGFLCIGRTSAQTYSEYYVSYSNLRAEINVTDSINMIGIFVIVPPIIAILLRFLSPAL